MHLPCPIYNGIIQGFVYTRQTLYQWNHNHTQRIPVCSVKYMLICVCACVCLGTILLWTCICGSQRSLSKVLFYFHLIFQDKVSPWTKCSPTVWPVSSANLPVSALTVLREEMLTITPCFFMCSKHPDSSPHHAFMANVLSTEPSPQAHLGQFLIYKGNMLYSD